METTTAKETKMTTAMKTLPASLKLPRMKCPCGGQFDWLHPDRSPSGANCKKCGEPYKQHERVMVTLAEVRDVRMEVCKRGSFGNTSVVLFTTKHFPASGNFKGWTSTMHGFASLVRFERTAAGKVTSEARFGRREEYQGSDEEYAAALAAAKGCFLQLLDEIAADQRA